MAKKRNKPTASTSQATTSEPDIDVEPVTPIEPDVELVDPAPTTYKQVESMSKIEPTPTQKRYGKYVPSRKWAASTVGAIGTVLIMWATTGTWDQEETVASITLGVTAITAYLLKNASGDPNEQDIV